MDDAHSSPDQISELSEIAGQFRQDWSWGKRPKIKPLLTRFPDGQQSEVLRELLGIELEERVNLGEQPTRWDYYPTFPAFKQTIDTAFESHAQKETSATESSVETTPPTCVPNESAPLSPVDPFEQRYQLHERLGGGAYGDVYRATDTELHREVAIKTLRVDKNNLGPILREARVAAKLKHPAIVTIYDLVRRPDGSGCIVMEHVAGQTLEQWLDSHRCDRKSFLDLLATVADGLQHAHMAGLIHRDLKPANILVDVHGEPHIADFGLALHETEQRNRHSQLAGTPCYMSPEQIRGETHLLDGRCDIWALGIILYESLTGKAPFRGLSRRELFDEIQRKAPRPPRMVDNTIPHNIEQVCLKCLEKDVTKRYTNAEDLATDLRAAAPVKSGKELETTSNVHPIGAAHQHDDSENATKASGSAFPSVRLLCAVVFLSIAAALVFFLSTPRASNTAGGLAPAVTVARGEDQPSVDLAECLPIRTGYNLQVSWKVPVGYETGLFWFDADARLWDLSSEVVEIEESDGFQTFVWPGLGRGTTVQGNIGTEAIFVGARRRRLDGSEKNWSLLDGVAPIPAIEWPAAILVGEAEPKWTATTGTPTTRSPGAAVSRSDADVSTAVTRIQKQLETVFESVQGVAFPHVSP